MVASCGRVSLSVADAETLALLYAVILSSALLEESGALERLAVEASRASRGSVRRLLGYLALASLATSSVAMNDTSVIMYAPVAVSIVEMTGVDRGLAVSVVALAANVGSSLTPIGNPQNMVIWRHYGVSFTDFVTGMAPLVVLGAGLLVALIALAAKAETLDCSCPVGDVTVRWRLVVASLTSLAAAVALAESGQAFLGAVAAVVVVLAAEPTVMLRVDYRLLASIALMLVDFRVLGTLVSPLVSGLDTFNPVAVTVVAALLSQAVSNVPATVLLVDRARGWLPLAYGVNVGGTGFVTGSLANIIAVRLAGIGARSMHRYSLPYFAALLTASIPLVWLLGPG